MKVVKMTTSSATNHENFIKMITLPFPCILNFSSLLIYNWELIPPPRYVYQLIELLDSLPKSVPLTLSITLLCQLCNGVLSPADL